MTLQITKKTTNSLYIAITSENSKKVMKFTVKDWGSVNDAIAYLKDDKDVKTLLEACNGILDPTDIARLRGHFFPTTKQVKAAKKRYNERQQWFDAHQSLLDSMTEQMANHDGFMSNKTF